MLAGAPLWRRVDTVSVTSSVTDGTPLLEAPWPYGSARPGAATAAAWLGRLTAVLTCLPGIALALGGGRGIWVAPVAALTATALVAGAHRLLAGKGRTLLLVAAVGAAAVLVLSAPLDAELLSEGLVGVIAWLAWVLPLPGLTIAFAALPRVGGWLAGTVPTGPLPYAPPPWHKSPDQWPYGPPRPASATSAAVLGIVTGTLTALNSPFFFLGVAPDGFLDPFTVILLLGLPCAAGLVAGGILLLRRQSRFLLTISASLATLVLLAAATTVLIAQAPGLDGALSFVGLALPFPTLTLVLAQRREVTRWLALDG